MMKHSLYIFIGPELESTAAGVMQHLLKYGTDDVCRHFSVLRWMEDGGQTTISGMVRKSVDDDRFYPGDDYLYQVEEQPVADITDDRRDEQIKSFFRNWYDTHVVIGSEGALENMLVSLVIPAANVSLKEQALHLVKVIDGGVSNVDVEVLLLAPDLYKVFVKDEDFLQELDKSLDAYNQSARENTSELLAARKQTTHLEHVVLLQNRNRHGIALNLSFESFTRIIAEYAVACIENYRQLYNPNLVQQGDTDGCVVGVGVSSLSMDKYYFLHYLLHHAYLWVMEREQVAQDHVDINKAASLARESLEDRQQVMTDFYKRYVQTELDKGRTAEDIIPTLRAHFDEFLSELEQVLTKYIDDPTMSLPEKFAVLAQILVMDEDSLSGNLYDKEQPTFIDLFREPVSYFLDYNNEMLVFKQDEKENVVKDPETGIPVIESGIITSPQGPVGYIYLPTDEIKQLRIEIRQASEYIRQKTEQLEQLEKTRQQNRKSDLVIVNDDDFRKFRLIDEDVKEDPFEEDYVPKPTTEDSVDLSPDFTPVRNQGALGSCTTFAVSSVYEYIMKKNDRSDHDLSERFLYYNVREEHNRLNMEGSSISDAIRSVHSRGICTEEMWPYSETDFNVKPSAEAYKDAELRKIKTAMNVRMGSNIEENRDALRSAIAEGYPVIISLRLFDSFFKLPPNGLVPMPADDEQAADKHNLHAMVVCGYDDANELFLVRNSWGVNFGKNGYCYIPYAYLCDTSLCLYSCIITEVSDASIKVRGKNGRHRIALDTTDLNIRIMIISNMIATKKKVQQRLVEIYNKVYAQYELLLQKLEDPTTREHLTKGANELYVERAAGVKKLLDQRIATKGEKLAAFDAQTTRNQWRVVMGVSGIVLFYLLFAYLRFDWSLLSRLVGMESFLKVTYAVAVVVVAVLLMLYAYMQSRKKARRRLEQDIDDEIGSLSNRYGRIRRQQAELKLRSFVAGLVIDGLSNLSTRLYSLRNSMRSYVNNLSAWYEEERECVSTMEATEKLPFQGILTNEALDAYFAQSKDELTREIKLYGCLHGEYEIDDEKIFEFKNALKKKLKDQLAAAIDGFNIYEQVAGLRQYDFIPRYSEDDLNRIIHQMDACSEPFVQEVNSVPVSKNFFVNNQQQENIRQWESLCRRNASGSMTFGQAGNPFSIQEVQIEFLPMDDVRMFK